MHTPLPTATQEQQPHAPVSTLRAAGAVEVHQLKFGVEANEALVAPLEDTAFTVCQEIAGAEREGMLAELVLPKDNISPARTFRLVAVRDEATKASDIFCLDVDDIPNHFALILNDGTVLNSELEPDEATTGTVDLVLAEMLKATRETQQASTTEKRKMTGFQLEDIGRAAVIAAVLLTTQIFHSSESPAKPTTASYDSAAAPSSGLGGNLHPPVTSNQISPNITYAPHTTIVPYQPKKQPYTPTQGTQVNAPSRPVPPVPTTHHSYYQSPDGYSGSTPNTSSHTQPTIEYPHMTIPKKP